MMENTIRVERAKKKITQAELAEKVNVSRQTNLSLQLCWPSKLRDSSRLISKTSLFLTTTTISYNYTFAAAKKRSANKHSVFFCFI